MIHRALATILFLCALFSPAQASQEESAAESLEAFKVNMERHLAKHRFLKKVEFEWVWDYEDFLILVQEPLRPEPGHVAKAAKLRSAESQRLNQLFKEGLATEYDVGLRSTAPRMTIIVLANVVEFGEYFREMFKSTAGKRSIYYDPVGRLLVTCDAANLLISNSNGEYRLLDQQERAMQILHAYSARSEALPDPFWLRLGLMQELCGKNDREQSKQGVGRASDWSYHQLCELIQSPGERTVMIPPLLSMLTQTGYRGILSESQGKAKALKLKAPNAWKVYQSFISLSGAFFHYLAFESSDDLRARTKACTEGSLKGLLRRKPFAEHFAGVDWAQVEVDFWQHVWKRHELESGDEEVAVTQFEAFLLERQGGETEPEVAAMAAGPVNVLDQLDSPDERLALAIAAMKTGDAKSADGILTEALANSSLEAPDRKRLEEEQLRVRAWIDLRSRYAQHLIDTGIKLNIDWNGKRLLAAITEFDEDRWILAPNNRDVGSLELAGLDPVMLARKMAEKRSEFEVNWAVAYPFVLDSEAKADRWLSGDEPERTRLARDAEHDYPVRASWVAAAGELFALGNSPPTEEERVDAPELTKNRLKWIETCWSRRVEVPFVDELRGTLGALAGLEFAAEFDELPLGEILRGQAEELRDGRVRLRYDFDNRDQLEDWLLDPAPGFHKRWRESLSDAYIQVSDGVLTGLGQISRTHVLAFEGPHSMIWEERALSGGSVSSEKQLLFRISLCTIPGEDTYLGALNSFDLCMSEARERAYEYVRPESSVPLFDTDYVEELLHDGESTVTLRRDGQDVISIPVASRKSGHPQIWFHSDYVVTIKELEIVGRITADSREALKNRWIAERVHEMGLSG